MYITRTVQGEREKNIPSKTFIFDFDVVTNLQCSLDMGHYLEFLEVFLLN